MKKLITIISSTLLLTACTPNLTIDSPTPNTAEPTTIEIPTQQEIQALEETSTTLPTSQYHGSYFSIQYPENFTVQPTYPSNLVEGIRYIQTDQASFTSPDEAIQFYIYSPQWDGEPNYINLQDSEEIIDQSTTESQGTYGKTINTFVTIKAKDNSYTRSYHSIREQVDTESPLHHVFGIAYKTQEAYDQYKQDYLNFKNSLIQYAD